MKKIGIIGVGKMGSAILHGILEKNLYNKEEIHVCVKSQEQQDSLLQENIDCNSLQKVFEDSEILILAIKPQSFPDFFASVKKNSCKAIIVSVAAGITLKTINNYMPNNIAVRTMPNTPVIIGHGVTTISRNSDISEEDFSRICKIFEAIGQIYEIPESQIDATMPLNGSMPAFIDAFVIAFRNAAIKQGVDSKFAIELIKYSLQGSIELLINSKKNPEELLADVCSPNGTTIAGINALQQNGFDNAIESCYKSCYERSKEMSK